MNEITWHKKLYIINALLLVTLGLIALIAPWFVGNVYIFVGIFLIALGILNIQATLFGTAFLVFSGLFLIMHANENTNANYELYLLGLLGASVNIAIRTSLSTTLIYRYVQSMFSLIFMVCAGYFIYKQVMFGQILTPTDTKTIISVIGLIYIGIGMIMLFVVKQIQD